MCDQDHFEDDRKEFEARGLVTRRQFGALVGAGISMMLPRVVNAVAVTEADVTVTTPDGTADCYFVHPASGAIPFAASSAAYCWMKAGSASFDSGCSGTRPGMSAAEMSPTAVIDGSAAAASTAINPPML